jgi:shikimate dehydrogenase
MTASRIKGATRVCALIGDPVRHSLSPAIQNAAFEALGLDIVYVAFRVSAARLSDAIEGIRSLDILGVNVTMPHKTAILRFLDRTESSAEETRAVNTIVRKRNLLWGYNTDGPAALKVLRSLAGSLSGIKAVILGAGGGARSVAYHISKDVGELAILNRTRTRGTNLAASIRRLRTTPCRSYILSMRNLRRETKRADLLVNTLPVEVFAGIGNALIREGLVRPDMLIMDINYKPRTDFVARAKAEGAKATEGLDMLLEQAALSFRLWTGRDPPRNVMREAAVRAKRSGQ